MSGSNTTLTPAQYACGTIRLTGTLLTDLTLTFPLVSGWWVIDNQTTANFAVQVICSPGGNRIGIPQGVASDIFTDGSNAVFRNLPTPGTYWDYAGSAVPRWVGFCTVAPWLNCDGSAFSAVTYPSLNTVLGSTTLPDFRGRSPFYLNGGTGRLTAAGAGIDGNTRFANGGFNGMTLAANQIPSITSSGNNSITVTPNGFFVYRSGSAVIVDFPSTSGSGLRAGGNSSTLDNTAPFAGNNTISVSYTNASQQLAPNAAPGFVGGIRMIRAG